MSPCTVKEKAETRTAAKKNFVCNVLCKFSTIYWVCRVWKCILKTRLTKWNRYRVHSTVHVLPPIDVMIYGWFTAHFVQSFFFFFKVSLLFVFQSFLIDRAGRKKLMGYGYLMMAVAMSLLTIMLCIKVPTLLRWPWFTKHETIPAHWLNFELNNWPFFVVAGSEFMDPICEHWSDFLRHLHLWTWTLWVLVKKKVYFMNWMYVCDVQWVL